MAVEEPCAPRGKAWPLRLLPRRLAELLLRPLFLAWAKEDVQRDATIWESKRYVETPALARGDGPIPQYRRWCRQFYPECSGESAAHDP